MERRQPEYTKVDLEKKKRDRANTSSTEVNIGCETKEKPGHRFCIVAKTAAVSEQTLDNNNASVIAAGIPPNYHDDTIATIAAGGTSVSEDEGSEFKIVSQPSQVPDGNTEGAVAKPSKSSYTPLCVKTLDSSLNPKASTSSQYENTNIRKEECKEESHEMTSKALCALVLGCVAALIVTLFICTICVGALAFREINKVRSELELFKRDAPPNETIDYTDFYEKIQEDLFIRIIDIMTPVNVEDAIQRKIIAVLQNVTLLEGALTSVGSLPNPAPSCAAIFDFIFTPFPSGYYWIRSSNGSAVHVYCDMTRSCGGVTGGWTRVAELDMTNSSSRCPRHLRQTAINSKRFCGVETDSFNLPRCSLVTFSLQALKYSKICGKIRAYQYGITNSFRNANRGNSVDDNYVDGVSLTHGRPRQHIWTFAAAQDEVGINPSSNCPCTNVNQANSATPPPAFVGNDFFCDTGSTRTATVGIFYGEDPLWDGAGCGPDNTCCSFNNPPWFYRQLPAPTTDDIEMRVCCYEGRFDEDIAIEAYEIYIQ